MGCQPTKSLPPTTSSCCSSFQQYGESRSSIAVQCSCKDNTEVKQNRTTRTFPVLKEVLSGPSSGSARNCTTTNSSGSGFMKSFCNRKSSIADSIDHRLPLPSSTCSSNAKCFCRAGSGFCSAVSSDLIYSTSTESKEVVFANSIPCFKPNLETAGVFVREERPVCGILDRFLKPSLLNSRIQRNKSITSCYTFSTNCSLGTGISGTVRIGIHKETGLQYAVKSLNVVNINTRRTALLYNEVAIYLKLDHPNIAKLFEVYEDGTAIHLVMELCTGKELYDRLVSKKKYSELDAAKVAHQMLSAVCYCHKHRICHRDLKLENWVYANPSENAPLKLIDFGFSRIFNPGVPMTAMHGTVYYVSPEVMDGCYKEKCDIWSIGVIVFMLLSGSPPFNGLHDHEILVKIKKAAFSFSDPRWKEISEEGKDFISYLLMKDPDKRLSAEDALNHPWLDPSRHTADVEIDINVLQTMRRFAAGSAMKRAALGVIAYAMQTKDTEELSQQFKKIDTAGSGTIKVDEIVNVLTTKLLISEDEAKHVFRAMDLTGDQEVHYSEFLASTLQAKMVLDESLIRSAFEKFDVDRNGYICLNNLRDVLGDQYDGKRIEDVLKGCPSKLDGLIDYDEFVSAVRRDEMSTPTSSAIDSAAVSVSKSLVVSSEYDQLSPASSTSEGPHP